MGEFFINLFLYAFSIYGVLIFFRELALLLNHRKYSCKVVLVIESGDTEEILRDVSWSLQENKVIENIYVLNKSNTDDSEKIIEKYCADNDFFISTDKQKIVEIINEDIKFMV